MTEKDKARRARMRFEIEKAISNGGDYKDLEKAIDTILSIHEANKPKPEPVAWLVQRNGYEYVTVSLSKDKAISYRDEVQMRSDLSGDLNDYRIKPLYTTPPTRKPLSNDEIEHLIDTMETSCGERLVDFVRAIEQAHGIGVSDHHQKVTKSVYNCKHL